MINLLAFQLANSLHLLREVCEFDPFPSLPAFRHLRYLLARSDPVEFCVHDDSPVPQQVPQATGNPLPHPDLFEVESITKTVGDYRYDIGGDVHPYGPEDKATLASRTSPGSVDCLIGGAKSGSTRGFCHERIMKARPATLRRLQSKKG